MNSLRIIPSLFDYIWKIGEDEEGEQLIDKALCLILAHQEFKQLLWSDAKQINALYDDKTFEGLVNEVLKKVEEICDPEKKLPFLPLTHSEWKKLHEMFCTNTEEEKEANLWSEKAKEFCLWSFIKYLEIEILSTPIIESRVVEEDEGNLANDFESELKRRVTIGKSQRRSSDIKHLLKPLVPLVKDNGTESKSYSVKFENSIQTAKYRVYKELVSKFVLEYENSDIRDDLWPWYENFKHRSDSQDIKNYFNIMIDFSDTRLTGHNSTYNLARKNLQKGKKEEEEKKSSDVSREYRHVRYLRKFAARFLLSQHSIEKSLFYIQKELKNSRKSTKQMKEQQEAIEQQKVNARRTMGNAFSPRLGAVSKNNRDELESMFDKSTISPLSNDDISVARNKEKEYIVTEEDRTNLQENYFLNDKACSVLLKNYQRNKDIQHTIEKERITLKKIKIRSRKKKRERMRASTNADITYAMSKQSSGSGGGKIMRSGTDLDVKHSKNMKLGDEFDRHHFFNFRIAVQDYWTVNHDMLLLELGLMFQLNVEKYKIIVTENKFFETRVENLAEGRKFVQWFENKLNVMHRLRYLTYIIIHKEKPKSRVFVNKMMRDTHIKYIEREKGLVDGKKLANNLAPIAEEKHNEDDKKQAESINITPVRDIIGEFRDVVRLLEPQRFGRRIWKFVIGELQHKQRESLWKVLDILADELPSKLLIKFLEEDKETIGRGKLEYIEELGRSVVGASLYPMAMALHVSRFMDENATRDLARYDKWKSMADMFENIAIELVYEIENDFLLALIMEVPTDIGSKSVFELAIAYHRTNFCNDARISALLSHMWVETEFLNPKHGIKASDTRFDKIYQLLYESPVGFYFCPMGLYYTTTCGYILYVLIMTYMTYEKYYPYYPLDFFQNFFWIMNGGYIFYEISEAFHKGRKYFSLDSILNVFDVIISFNWIVLFLIRYFPEFWEKVFDWEYCDPCCANTCENKTDCIADCGNDESEVCDYGCSINSHNRTLTLIFMAFWSVQCVILWIRVIGLFQRTKLLGPFLRVLMIIFTDLLSFFLLAGVVFIGFTYALYFIIGGDFDRGEFEDVPEDDEVTVYLGSVKGSGLYILQTFLGQQDWEILSENETYTFGRARARVAEGLVMLFILFGTILLLNLLIAVMSNTFTLQQQQAQQELAFSRLETTYDLAHRGRLMPPPYNLFARLILIVIEIVFYCIAFYRMYNLDGHGEFDAIHLDLVEKLNPYFSQRLHKINDKLISRDNSEKMEKKEMKKKEKTKEQRNHKGNEEANEKANQKRKVPRPQYVRSQSSDLASNLFANSSQDLEKENEVGDLFTITTQTRTSIASRSELVGNENENDNDNDNHNDRYNVFKIMKIIAKEGRAAKSSKKYCRFCYFRMHTHKGGDIESYLKRLETSGYALDDEDEERIVRLFRYCELCPLCYRPFGSYPPKKVDRYARHSVIAEIASFYVFLCFVWIPLLIILSIPALVSYYFNQTSKLDNTKNIQSQNGQNNFDIDPFADYYKGTWHNSIKKTIARVKLSQNNKHDNNNISVINHRDTDRHTQENEM